MGPLVTREHRDKVAGYLDAAARAGGDGRHRRTRRRDVRRRRVLPGRVADRRRPPDMDCYTDEIFGPVLSVVRASSYDEALGLVNDNPYGNGVAIFTRDGGAARQFQFDVNVGMVGVNVPIPVPVVVLLVRRLEGVALRRPRTCTARTASTSTRGRRSSRRAGPTRAPAASTSDSRGPGDGRHEQLLDREEAAWARMWAQVERVPPANARARAWSATGRCRTWCGIAPDGRTSAASTWI